MFCNLVGVTSSSARVRSCGYYELSTENSDQRIATLIREWLERPVPTANSVKLRRLGAVIATTVGAARSQNEDRAVVARVSNSHARTSLICLLCDGMSVFKDGRAAAVEAITAMLISVGKHCSYPPLERLRSGLNAANTAIYRRDPPRAGTTIAALLLSHDDAVAATVGDSRVYSFSKQTRLRQISIDDTLGQELERLQQDGGPRLNLTRFSRRLTKFIGMAPTVEGRYYQLGAGTLSTSYILSSDGAHWLGKPAFDAVLSRTLSSHNALDDLIRLSQNTGKPDDASLISIRSNLPKTALGEQEAPQSRLEVWDSSGKLDISFDNKESDNGDQPTTDGGFYPVSRS